MSDLRRPDEEALRWVLFTNSSLRSAALRCGTLLLPLENRASLLLRKNRLPSGVLESRERRVHRLPPAPGANGLRLAIQQRNRRHIGQVPPHSRRAGRLEPTPKRPHRLHHVPLRHHAAYSASLQTRIYQHSHVLRVLVGPHSPSEIGSAIRGKRLESRCAARFSCTLPVLWCPRLCGELPKARER